MLNLFQGLHSVSELYMIQAKMLNAHVQKRQFFTQTELRISTSGRLVL